MTKLGATITICEHAFINSRGLLDLMHGGAAYDFSLLNPRLIGTLAAGLWLCWSRNILGCLASGMIAYSLARVLL